jgi:HD-GYP domain-containing protein (c-di-GMP phosphodiesterase class II)
MTEIADRLKPGFSRWLPRRIRLLHLILLVLLAISVIPLLVYGLKVSSRNKEALQTNEQLLQDEVTSSMAEQIRLFRRSMDMRIEGLVRMLESTGALANVADPKHAPSLQYAIESFVRGSEDEVLFLTVVNAEQRGIAGGNPEVGGDPFVIQRLSQAFRNAMLGNEDQGGTLAVPYAGAKVPVMITSKRLIWNGEFHGVVAAVINLESLRQRLIESSRGFLVVYVVDREGHLVLHPDDKKYNPGFDMTQVKIVQEFVQGTAQIRGTTRFELVEQGKTTEMLGTQVPVPDMNWAVIAQKPVERAYYAALEMERYALVLGLVTVFLSVGVGYYSARRLTTPIQVLAASTRAIAKGDFSRRVQVASRTEIGELAETFNVMTGELEQYVEQLKQAAQENHELFLGSIRTLAAAIDEKDPYTRGHSGRVAKYSVILAETMGLSDEEIYKIRISALLHDVGKIGIDDRILKKPAGLTSEEFEVMKQHPVKGANIIRPVAKLREMIPGIELHHESLDGRGYPYGLKGEEIPLMARVIMVADTLDAMTTNRPYQAAMELEPALAQIRAIVGKKFDPAVVDALQQAVEKEALRIAPQMVEV